MIEFWKKITKADMRNTIAMVWVICSFAFLFILLKTPIPAANKELAVRASDVILMQLTVILGYFFIQSKTEVDEKRKDENN